MKKEFVRVYAPIFGHCFLFSSVYKCQWESAVFLHPNRLLLFPTRNTRANLAISRITFDLGIVRGESFESFGLGGIEDFAKALRGVVEGQQSAAELEGVESAVFLQITKKRRRFEVSGSFAAPNLTWTQGKATPSRSSPVLVNLTFSFAIKKAELVEQISAMERFVKVAKKCRIGDAENHST